MKAIELKKFLDDNSERLDNLEFFSIMNCLTEKDIESLYFDYGFEGLVLRYIEKYNKEHKREYRKVISDLLSTFEQTLESERKDLRDTLVNVISNLKTEIQKRIFHLLSNSNHAIENRRAAQISHLIWNEEIQQKVIDLYRKKYDKFIGVELINNLDHEDVSRYFQELWNDALRNLEKQKLIEKANLSEVEIKEYLKKGNLKFYLLYLVRQKENLDIVQDLYSTIEYQERTYIKWMAGKMKCGELLLQLIELDRDLKEEWN